MAENITLSRPYAKAIFELAQKANQFEEWSLMLQTLCNVANDSRIQSVLSDYTIDVQENAKMFIDVSQKVLNKEGENLIRILAKARKLKLLPDIADQFFNLRNEALNVVNAECSTVIPLNDEEKRSLTKLLSEKMQKKVQLKYKINPDLIGGFIVRAGDILIDGSILGNLYQMKEVMNS